jgi:hypothetical protein
MAITLESGTLPARSPSPFSGMDAADTIDGRKYIGSSKIIIVVCMKIKGQLRVPFDDGLAKSYVSSD